MATWKKVITDGLSLTDIGTPASDDKVLVQDTSDSDIVKYVDFGDIGGGGGDVVDDTTPQLGGDLDLNSNDITGTGNISITGNLVASGTLSTLGNATYAGNASVSGTLGVTGTTTLGTVNVSSKLTTPAIDFSGLGGTSTVGISTVGGGSPSDLELQSNGNVTVNLDYDSNEAAQAFIVKNQAGTIIFQVDEDGITSGLLTTATPTISGLSSTVQQGGSGSCTVGTTASGRSFAGAIYNSSGVEQTSNPVTIDSSGNVSFTAPSTVGTGYELRIYAVDAGKLRSLEDVETFEVTASRTFTYWRVRAVDSGGADSSNKCAWVELNFYTGASATGTVYPTTNATSNTSISGVTISAGQQYSSSYAEWRAFDGTTGQNAGSMWWTLGGNAANNWIQVQFSSAQTFSSLTVEVYDNFNDATHLQVEGSSSGAFTGEEVVFGLNAISEGSGATTTTVNF